LLKVIDEWKITFSLNKADSCQLLLDAAKWGVTKILKRCRSIKQRLKV
jgi:hypothetical protein